MQHATLVVGTAAVKVLGPGTGGVLVQADTANTADVYVGGNYVTADGSGTGGIRIAAGVMLPLVIAGNDPLWAIAPSGSQLLRVIQGSDNGNATDFGAQ